MRLVTSIINNKNNKYIFTSIEKPI